MVQTAFTISGTGYFFTNRRDAEQTIRNTYCKIANVTITPYARGAEAIVEPHDGTRRHILSIRRIEILTDATHL